MSSPWGKVSAPVETMSFAEIMSEEYAQHVQQEELKKYNFATLDKEELTVLPTTASAKPMDNEDNECDDESEWVDCNAALLLEAARASAEAGEELLPELIQLLREDEQVQEQRKLAGLNCESDEAIALMLQRQYNNEYNEQLRRAELMKNKSSKVTVVLDKDSFAAGSELPSPTYAAEPCDEDDLARLVGADEKELRIAKQFYNKLKFYSRRELVNIDRKRAKMQDRKENVATADMGLDAYTCLLLYKMINNHLLDQINGIICTGKEAIILHANSDANYAPVAEKATENGEQEEEQAVEEALGEQLHKEFAIKVFKTTLNEFKQRDRYIKDDYRFKDRFKERSTKQKKLVVIRCWAEKEMHNLKRMRSAGIKCPEPLALKNHVLVMSFIGRNNVAAPQLKDVQLSDAELAQAYEEVVEFMKKLYNEAQLVHADLSEYNILWHDGQCWFIDVAQAVEPRHPSALEFLMRDCNNVVTFFKKRGLPKVCTKEQLFTQITNLNPSDYNVAMLERLQTTGITLAQASNPCADNCPDALKPIVFPFDLAWEKSLADKASPVVDDAADAMRVICIKCGEEVQKQKHLSVANKLAAVQN